MNVARLSSGAFYRQPSDVTPIAVQVAPLRVLVVTNMFPTADRPVMGSFVAEQVASLRCRGLVLDVLFVDGPGSKINYASGLSDVRRIALSAPYGLIHAHYVFSAMLTIASTAMARCQLPIVVTQHGIEAQQGWTAPLCRWTSRRTAYTIATSSRVAAALPGVRQEVIPCGVDTDLFRPLPRDIARQALGLPADTPLVLFVGDPRPEKRIPLIQAAVARLQVRLPAARLLLVHGEPRERIPLYMSACDVLVLASTAEGSPMVVREALACDLPVVSTDVGDVPELLDGLAGCHIAAATEEDLADKLAQSLTRRARSTSRARILPWSLDGVAEKIEAVYRKVI
ncbi:MAG: hypothetical protein CVU38_00290 [Chloroflexi bacterium HGW-Chloroflexi-1]|nr:MAG: hypothetical protein CVU38_00290 [Chloroflexi bacterium HGW-Chloroflexi-1]